MKTIRKKLTTIVCLLSLVICIAISGINLYTLNQTALHGMDMAVTTASKAYAGSVANAINVYRTKIEAIAKDTRITLTASAIEIMELQKGLATEHGLKNVIITNSDGFFSDESGNSVAMEKYFQEAIKGNTYLSTPVVKPEDGSVALYIAARIKNGTGYYGVILAELEYEAINQIISDVTIGKQGIGFIIDKEGTTVAHPDFVQVQSHSNAITLSKTDASYVSLGALTSEMLQNQAGIGEAVVDGSQKYMAYEPIKNTDGWILAISADKAEMMIYYYNGLLISVIFTLSLLLISFIFVFLFSKSISRPISLVSKRLKLLSQGDLKSDIPSVKSNDEIYTLATSLGETTRTLRSYIQDISYMLSNISAGDLTVKTDQEYAGDFTDIKASMQGITASLNDIMSHVNSVANQVSDGSNMVSDSSLALSQGATEQASAIQELTASLQEISAQTSRNADNAAKASELANNAKTNAASGNEQMTEMLIAMDEINESSANIRKVIKVIDDIAFQTNILALNAAVEAARAGQYGKGFAVVAEEVRTLAAKSANAAKETTDMIEGSIRKVEAGMKIANQTARTLGDIVVQVEDAANLVNSISSSSQEQALGIEQINQGVNQISQVVNTNAATSEESAAASEELSSQAQQLKEAISVFKLSEGAINYSLFLPEGNLD